MPWGVGAGQARGGAELEPNVLRGSRVIREPPEAQKAQFSALAAYDFRHMCDSSVGTRLGGLP
jgi:hypothetical protein